MSQSPPADPLPALVQDADRQVLDARIAVEVMGAQWVRLRPNVERLRDERSSRIYVATRRDGVLIEAEGLRGYASDWSAIRLVEDEIERLGLMDDYAWRLEELVAADNAKRDHYAPAHVNMLRASCEQRCKAALAVCGALHDRRTDA